MDEWHGPEQGTPAFSKSEMRRFPLSEAPLIEHAHLQVSHHSKVGLCSEIRE